MCSILGAAPVRDGESITMHEYVFYDDNSTGMFDESADPAIEGVRGIYTRDYECNGIIDGDDEIYDYDYTVADGSYFLPTRPTRC